FSWAHLIDLVAESYDETGCGRMGGVPGDRQAITCEDDLAQFHGLRLPFDYRAPDRANGICCTFWKGLGGFLGQENLARFRLGEHAGRGVHSVAENVGSL